MYKTAIVILNWNGLAFLKMFLGSLIDYSTDSETVVCIADNGSTDGSPEWVASTYAGIKLIRLDKNYGFAGGYNMALDKIEAKYFVLVNSDIEVTPGWLQPLVRFMDSNDDVASCQPKILSYHKREYFEYAGAAGGFIDKYGYPFCRGRIFDKIEEDKGQYNSQIDVFWSSGACMMVRSDAWKRCGGFDPGFFAHMEEIDLCWRFNKAGYRVSFIPDSEVYHVGGGSLPYEAPFKTYLNFRNNLYLLYKNLPDNRLHSILFIRKLLDGVAAAMFLLKGNPKSVKSVWNAHIEYYKRLSELKIKRKIVKESEINHFPSLILNKSIVFEFYVKGNKTFNSLKTETELK
jgi:GT2 family glycosyltransferase